MRKQRHRPTAALPARHQPFDAQAIARSVRQSIDAADWQKASNELEPLLASDRSNPAYRWVAGLLADKLHRESDALGHLRYAAEHIADEPELYERLASLEQAAGNARAAERAYEQALTLRRSPATLLGYSSLLESEGNVERAIALLEEAHDLEPRNHAVVFKLGCLHSQSFDPASALKWAVRATELGRGHWDSSLLLGTVLQRLGRVQDALGLYQSLLLLRPNSTQVLHNLAVLCVRSYLNADAIRYLEREAALSPERLDLDILVFQQLLFLSDWSQIAARTESLLERLRNGREPASPFGVLSIPGATALDLKRVAERTSQSLASKIEPIGSRAIPVTSAEQNRRLRIGYLSCDFHEHATAYLMARMLEQHDRAQFELYAYSWNKPVDSPVRQRITATFDVFRDIRSLTDAQSARLIAQDEVDILVDLKGYTTDSRPAILAHRPAPVQVHHVGFPGTLGAPFVDYLVADRFVAPPEHPEYFTEKIAYLPNCYQPNDERRTVGPQPSRADCGLPEHGVVFCCFNQTYKLTPDIFDIWCDLLRAVEGSVLWLPMWSRAPTSTENLRAQATVRGVLAHRLIAAPQLPQSAHLGRLQNADIALDTLPINAHTTTSDAVWAGVPVVTLPGETFVSRVAGSIVTTLGLPDLVARDREDYFRIALELARSPEHLAAVKARVRTGCTDSPLFDSARYTRDLEALYRVMWQRRVAGLAPAAITTDGELR